MHGLKKLESTTVHMKGAGLEIKSTSNSFERVAILTHSVLILMSLSGTKQQNHLHYLQ